MALTASDSTLILARQSGAIYQFHLPSLIVEAVYQLGIKPKSISLNIDSTRLAIIDLSSLLKILELEIKLSGVQENDEVILTTKGGQLLNFERSGVWEMKW